MNVAQTVANHTLPIADEHDVIAVRRKARELAEQHGFDRFATTAITTATSELARNALVHGGGGETTIEVLDRDDRRGLRIIVRDQGPGIKDLDAALRGGTSTAGSMGLGLSGSRRLVDEFAIDSQPGAGVIVTVVKWTRS